MTNLRMVAQSFIRSSPEKVSSLSVVEHTAPPPSDEVRSTLSQFYRDVAPSINTALLVAEGGGFRSAIVRGVGITLSSLAPKSLPFKFASSLQEAARLLVPHISRAAGGPAALERAVDEVRDEITRYTAAMEGRAR